jgi:methylenetetrahydrofolate dehydrogenase (NADP+)/methenyltetrahydrofolate cyclohydrolase
MTAQILDGEVLARKRFEEVTQRANILKARGVVPHLTTILVGEDPQSAIYISRKHENCQTMGVSSKDIRLPSSVSETELLDLIAELNIDPAVHGIMVQLPLPDGFDPAPIMDAISPKKDVDGLHPINLGYLLAGTPTILPCTPAGIQDLLVANNIALAGKRVTIVGRGALVGRPLSMVLSLPGCDAEVTMVHSHTKDLSHAVKDADVVISAVGQTDLITASMVRDGAVVVGVGITYRDGEMISDIAADVACVASYVTPMRGSVGAMTRAHLLLNLIKIAEADIALMD